MKLQPGGPGLFTGPGGGVFPFVKTVSLFGPPQASAEFPVQAILQSLSVAVVEPLWKLSPQSAHFKSKISGLDRSCTTHRLCGRYRKPLLLTAFLRVLGSCHVVALAIAEIDARLVSHGCGVCIRC